MGPLTVEKLHAMARRGRFGRHFEVSTDGKRWGAAEDFPELFPGGGGGHDDDDFDDFNDEPDDDGGAEDDFDPYAPIVDEKPARRSSGRSSGGNGRSRRTSRRSSGEESPRRGRAGSSRPSRRRGGGDEEPRSRSRSRRGEDEPAPRAPADFDDMPPANIDEPPPKKKKKKKKKNVFDEAQSKEPRKKKRGGLMGMLFGGTVNEAAAETEPHMRKLVHVHNSMRSIGFGLDELTLIGSGGERINCGEHEGSGDGPHLLGLITLIAFQSRTTDMHFEPTEDSVEVRMRIDGTLVKLVEIDKDKSKRLYGVIKVLCETKMGANQEVLEGNYSTKGAGRRSDYRVSFTPSVHGQKLAIRVLDADNAPVTLKQLGAPGSFVSTINGVMKQNAGMVLMCGPTGSGKTTSLYAMLRSVDFQSRNVMTLEDPVEYQIDGITQINIDKDHGKGFGEMLPALLRQDPDVLLIGEIRDGISAKIAMQATMTGHLVLSTLHAPDTLSTVHRLLDLNADANMVSSALDLVMSQRLLRTLCEECKRRIRPSDDDKRRLKGIPVRDAIYEPRGCKKCLGTGYSGRRAIFELLDVKKQLGDAIIGDPTMIDLRKAVKNTKFQSLRQNGYALVGQGVTTFSEVDRVIGVEK